MKSFLGWLLWAIVANAVVALYLTIGTRLWAR